MRRSPARAPTTRPVLVEPVNWIMSTRSTTAAPVAPRPVAQPRTGGAPISRHPSTAARQASGVTSDGFDSTAQPAASAAGMSSIGIASG